MEARRRRINSVKVRGRENKSTRLYALNALTFHLSAVVLTKAERIPGLPKPWRRRHVATARNISKILFPDNPVNVPVIK